MKLCRPANPFIHGVLRRFVKIRESCNGEGEIRTLGTLITFARFRGGCLQPLDHLSVVGRLGDVRGQPGL
jgi:hypothetical protein